MTATQTAAAVAAAGQGTDQSPRAWRLAGSRLRSPVFWQVQALVGAITAVHYVMEGATSEPLFDHVHHVLPALYVYPIIYASLRSGREGGLLTGLLCTLLTLPNIVLWHQSSGEWLVELVQIGSSVIVGLVLSVRVEHEAAERRRAEDMTAQVVLVNRKITRAQEDERLRIARELHDDTVQSLVLLCHRLDGLAATPGMSGQAQTSIGSLRALAEETLVGARHLGRDLRPSILDDLGLVAAVEWLTDEFGERTGIQSRLSVDGPAGRLPPETELALFRIVQEALRNVEKHADASEVTVTIAFEHQRLRLSVRDNGTGLGSSPSSGELVASGRLGITGMQERAELIGANLNLSSEPGQGTLVTATLDETELLTQAMPVSGS